MAKKFIATSVHFSLYTDDWNEGESIDPVQSWYETEAIDPADSIEELLKQVPHLDAGYHSQSLNEMFDNDPCKYNDFGRFDADLCVNAKHDNGEYYVMKPTDEQMCKFQKAEIQLYALHISVQIEKIDCLTADDIAESSFCK